MSPRKKALIGDRASTDELASDAHPIDVSLSRPHAPLDFSVAPANPSGDEILKQLVREMILSQMRSGAAGPLESRLMNQNDKATEALRTIVQDLASKTGRKLDEKLLTEEIGEKLFEIGFYTGNTVVSCMSVCAAAGVLSIFAGAITVPYGMMVKDPGTFYTGCKMLGGGLAAAVIPIGLTRVSSALQSLFRTHFQRSEDSTTINSVLATINKDLERDRLYARIAYGMSRVSY